MVVNRELAIFLVVTRELGYGRDRELGFFMVVNREFAIFLVVNRELGYGRDREFGFYGRES